MQRHQYAVGEKNQEMNGDPERKEESENETKRKNESNHSISYTCRSSIPFVASVVGIGVEVEAM